MASPGMDKEIEKKLYEALILGTKASNSFPGENDDLEYLENIPEFKQRIAEFRDRLVKLILDLANNVDSSDDLFNLGYLRNADPSSLETFEPISNVIDLLLENVDTYLDEAKQELSYSTSDARDASSSSMDVDTTTSANKQVAVSKSELLRGVRAGLHGVVTHANMERPQLKFKEPLDNARNPFKPKLTTKPHAIDPLPVDGLKVIFPEETSEEMRAHARNLGLDMDMFSVPRYPNPYETEIKAALNSPPSFLYVVLDPGQVKPLNETPCTWVDTEEKLNEMCAQLEGERDIAIDLENHSYRSFQGFVCLMQISTRKADFLVDTLALRDSLQKLNRFFCDPNIIKVLHGADHDVLWLQRDFGLYLVSLFDTGQAARILQYQSAGLAHALQKHCGVRVNKAYQLADWRVRPLSDEMFKYAREDTHYLLYVYDKMRNELLQSGGKDAVYTALKKSAEIALSTYEKELFTPNSYRKLLTLKNVNDLTPVQTQIFSAVFSWRDSIARREDESTQYVLPDRMLIRIAQEMPQTASDLERCCNPLPPIVQTRVTEILALVRSAQNNAKNQMEEDEDEDDEAEKEIRTLTNNNNEMLSSDAAVAAVQIGLNAAKSTFVPINSTLIKHAKDRNVTFAAGNVKGGDRRGKITAEANARATPSPVLTTEQLYDTAGWQDLSDPTWKASVVSKEQQQQQLQQQLQKSPLKSSPLKVQENHHQTAMATKLKIGEEQLQEQQHLASASKMSEGESDDDEKDDDVPMDIDTPADADALESEDRHRSMREIYRISNRNRKRNKDKKKSKDDTTGSSSSGKKKSHDDDKGSKRSKDGGDDGSSHGGGDDSLEASNDDAIDFMRGIGWVEGKSKPVATLVVQGAPEEPSYLAGASPPDNNSVQSGGDRSQKSRGGSGGGANANKPRRKIPASPNRRRSSNQSTQSSSQKQGQPTSSQQQLGFNYSQAAAKPVSSGFSYSQAAASAAGVRPSGGPSNPNQQQQSKKQGGGRPGGGGTGANVYRGKGSYGKSMSYSK